MPRQNARSFVGLCASLLVIGALVFVAMSPSAAQGPCRGNWAEGNTYNVGDSVRYNNATYLSSIPYGPRRRKLESCLDAVVMAHGRIVYWWRPDSHANPTPTPTPA